MPTIKITSNLKRFYPELSTLKVDCHTVKEAIELVEQNYAGIKNYLLDEKGVLREHVNIYIGSELIKDRDQLQDRLRPTDEVYIMQAISGG